MEQITMYYFNGLSKKLSDSWRSLSFSLIISIWSKEQVEVKKIKVEKWG